jgi:hypothetical protein
MSQCRAGKRRSSLIALIVIFPLLASCSFTELEKFATENDIPDTSQAVSSGGSGGKSSGEGVLVFDSVIKGGKEKFGGVAGTFRRYIVGAADEVQFIQPVAVGGINNFLYVVDAGARVVFRYDLVSKEIEPIGDVGIQFQGAPGNIFVTKDRSFYIVDSVGKQVFHFSEDGLLLNTFKDPLNLSRPMDVYVDETTREVYVADGSYSHIVIFNEFGKSIRAIGRRGTGPGRFRAITSITKGLDGLYVTDRLELPVQVITLDGQFRYSFGESQQVFPTAVAVNDDQLAFVSDKSDNTIRVYENGELQAIAGGGGAAPGRFRLITDLYVNGQYLYVADSLNKRIQVMRIVSKQSVSPLLPLPSGS